MSSQFLTTGKTISPLSGATIIDLLPAKNYQVHFNNNQGFHLIETEPFSLPSKLYGDIPTTAAKIMNTYRDKGGNLGCLFVGEKGSGKTLIAKVLSEMGKESGMPTILVGDGDFKGNAFNAFLGAISQPCVVIFDEFEKMYDRQAQGELLSLLGGTHDSKKLFLLTANDSYLINDFMYNRPGRIFYSKHYYGLDRGFVEEYCRDNLNNQEHTGSVLNVHAVIPAINFDMLQSLVEEMNRYNETATQSLKLLNIKPDISGGTSYSLTLVRNGQLIPNFEKVIRVSPLSSKPSDYWDINPVCYWPLDSELQDDETQEEVNIRADNLIKLDKLTGEMIFSTDVEGLTIHAKAKKSGPLVFDYEAL